MKKQLSLVLFGLAAISLTGCYTQVAVQEDDDSYVYQPIIYYPAPEPDYLPEEPYYPPTNPVEPEYKTRPINSPPGGKIRNPGKKRDPVTPPKRDDIRNSGGRNDGGRKSRR